MASDVVARETEPDLDHTASNVIPLTRGGRAWRGAASPRLPLLVRPASSEDARRRVATSALKRLFDVIAAAALLLLLAPLLLAIAVLIRLDTAGPILFRQRRTGFKGDVFAIYKFRTMAVMEDAVLSAATRDDRRVTRVGAILRRTSLDELPQLLNVLKGEMSLVGPRPHAIAHDLTFRVIRPDYQERFEARPGITGLAQVTGHRGEVRDDTCLHGRLDADLAYIRHWSFWLDLKILLATAQRIWDDEKAY